MRVFFSNGVVTVVDTFEQLTQFQFPKPIVFTTGCFDVFHAGHVHLLREARSYGACLVVGLDTDESVRKLKGSARPVYTFDERLSLLLANRHVDYVIEGCTEEWPDIMRSIRVDFFVKGAEYRDVSIELYKYAAQVKYVSMFGNRHSSSVIADLEKLDVTVVETPKGG